MQDNSDKTRRTGKRILRRRRLRKPGPEAAFADNPFMPRGYDPELLYVECGRCGAPVLWEPGRATRLLEHAGVDPLELDAACMLVTDSCPACGQTDDYAVRIFRVSDRPLHGQPPAYGHA